MKHHGAGLRRLTGDGALVAMLLENWRDAELSDGDRVMLDPDAGVFAAAEKRVKWLRTVAAAQGAAWSPRGGVVAFARRVAARRADRPRQARDSPARRPRAAARRARRRRPTPIPRIMRTRWPSRDRLMVPPGIRALATAISRCRRRPWSSQ